MLERISIEKIRQILDANEECDNTGKAAAIMNYLIDVSEGTDHDKIH